MSEYNKYVRTNIAEMRSYVPGEDLNGISVSPEDNPEEDCGMIARNPNNHNDQWYVNRAYFRANFKPLDGEHMTFGQALHLLKSGYKVRRRGWNGKGMFLFLLPGGTIPKSAIHDPKLKEVLDNNGKDHFEALGSIRMKTADDKILTGWLASQTDMLAEDWEVVE